MENTQGFNLKIEDIAEILRDIGVVLLKDDGKGQYEYMPQLTQGGFKGFRLEEGESVIVLVKQDNGRAKDALISSKLLNKPKFTRFTWVVLGLIVFLVIVLLVGLCCLSVAFYYYLRK